MASVLTVWESDKELTELKGKEEMHREAKGGTDFEWKIWVGQPYQRVWVWRWMGLKERTL